MSGKKEVKPILAVGYVRQDEGIYTAICVNMNLFAQAATSEKAFEKIVDSIVDYVKYIHEEHPKDWEKYLYRYAPDEFVAEFVNSLKQMERLSKPISPRKFHKKPLERFHLPVRSFAEQISVT